MNMSLPASHAAQDALPGELRVLVLAPTGRDARLITNLLRQAGILAEIGVSFDDIEHGIQRGAGAVIIAEEALNETEIARLRRYLERQPSWSDFPLILLTKAGKVSPRTMRSTEQHKLLGNVLLLERPVRPETLISTVQRMLQTRRRQYEIRDYLHRQSQAEATLRQTEKLAVVGRLSATIAHEINNPLESITNLLYLMRPYVSGEGARFLSIAEAEAERIAVITKQTLAFYRDTGKAGAVALPQLMEEILRLLHPKVSQRQIHVQRDYGQTEVWGVKGELRQLFLNLVDNAISAAPVGGAVRIVIGADGDCARVSITDSGRGVPRENLESIFQPFFTTKGFGTGLGLWVAQDIAVKHGGGIKVDPQTEGALRGATFHVTLANAKQIDSASPSLAS